MARQHFERKLKIKRKKRKHCFFFFAKRSLKTSLSVSFTPAVSYQTLTLESFVRINDGVVRSALSIRSLHMWLKRFFSG